jgi:hypothetical protein
MRPPQAGHQKEKEEGSRVWGPVFGDQPIPPENILPRSAEFFSFASLIIEQIKDN